MNRRSRGRPSDAAASSLDSPKDARTSLAGIELAGSSSSGDLRDARRRSVDAKAPEARRGRGDDGPRGDRPGEAVAVLRGSPRRRRRPPSRSASRRPTALAEPEQPEAARPAARGPADRARAVAVDDRRRAGRRPNGAPSALLRRRSPPARRRPGCSRNVASSSCSAGLGHPELDRADRRRCLKGLPPADERLRELLEAPPRGASPSARHDAAAGAKVFEKNCAACHQIGGKGAKVGPQLDGIGIRGWTVSSKTSSTRTATSTRRSARPNLALKDGQVVSGLLLREEGEVLVLADAQGKEVRVPKETVEERTISQLSPMPANMAEQIAEPEFYDLLAYLLEQLPARTRPRPRPRVRGSRAMPTRRSRILITFSPREKVPRRGG